MSELVGQRVAIARIAAGLSQQHLADEFSKSGFPMRQSAVSKVERGTRELSLNEATKTAEILGVGLEWLAGLSDNDGPDDESIRIEFEKAKKTIQKAFDALRPYLDEQN